MSFQNTAVTEYEHTENGIVYKGRLPKSALEQFDIYTACLAYWESKTPETWAVVKSYIVANSEVMESNTGIILDVKELNFHQVKILMDKYMSMAVEFFTSPQVVTDDNPNHPQKA